QSSRKTAVAQVARQQAARPKKGIAQRAGARDDVVVPALMKPVVEAFANAKDVSVEKGWGADSVAMKTRGKIFLMLGRGDLVFKLPSARVHERVAGGAKRFDPRQDGREMKEWLVVPLGTRDRVQLAREAFEFVSRSGR